MDIVEFTCGNCQQQMSVLREHLGTNVQCPHCNSVVAAVDPQDQTDSQPARDGSDDGEESIFASGTNASDDLFGESSGPQIEMPSDEQTANVDAAGAIDDASLLETHEPVVEDELELVSAAPEEPPFADDDTQVVPDQFADGTNAFEDAEPDNLPENGDSRLVTKHRKASIWGPIALIFLVPYSIVMTGCVIFLLANRQSQNLNHLELLRDTNPDQGGPQRVANPLPHDLPLTADQKTRINKSITLGITAVLARKIVLTKDGDLQIHMTMKNLSSDLKYNPLPDAFLRPTLLGEGGGKPYFFLDAGSLHLYGGYVAYENAGMIGPNESESIVVTTYDHDRDKVKKLLKNKSRVCVWRVHLRRGMYKFRGNEISTTGVIGVVFRPNEVRAGT